MELINKYSLNNDLELHLKLLDIFRNKTLATKYKAAALLGSFARGKPDRLSDLDILVWIAPEDLESASDELFKIKPFDIIHTWEKRYSKDHFFKKTIYSNFISSEIHVLTLENNFKLRRPYIVVKDPDSILESRTESGKPPEQEEFTPLGAGLDGIGWELFDMLKWWQRGKQELVKNHLKKVAAKLNEVDE